MMTPTSSRDHYCHSCGKTHHGWTEEQINRHRDELRAAEAARIDAARRGRRG